MDVITDELRKLAEDPLLGYASQEAHKECIIDIADRIDRLAQRANDDAYNAGYDAGYASADDWTSQHEDAMAEHGWVRLPKDADGVPIHVGDELTWLDEEVSHKVTCITLEPDGGWWVFASGYGKRPDKLRHHKQPTVEDVLREFALEIDGAADVDFSGAVTIAKYAAKLREMLAGDEE